VIVEFSEQALADPNSWPSLSQIFELFVDGRHRWLVPDWGRILSSAWYRGRGVADQKRIKALEQGVVMTARGAPRVVAVMDGTWSPNVVECTIHLPARNARDYLSHPLHVVVEDGPSDGAFIRAVLLVFAEVRLRRRLGQSEFERVRRSWRVDSIGDGLFFKVVHGGGSRIGDTLKGSYLSLGAPILAIVDSDHPTPQSEFAPLPRTTWAHAQRAADGLASDTNVTPKPVVRPLRRREMENYVPPAALKERYREEVEKIEFYAKLATHHRAHFDLKDGLSTSLAERDARTWRTTVEQEFWEQIHETDRELLFSGLGNKVWECWNSSTIHRQVMVDWAGVELAELVDVVLELL